ncbi:hypothetical protein SEA_NICEHOUSE_270 [Rhodococcus phage NiceHouse]|nr:hypothetical protein SEA_NICEHOUSE_270 [Rhodococcus phage NiceHouse]
MYEPDLVIECQTCGDEVYRSGDAAKKAWVADKPYNYIMWCRECRKAGHHLDFG